MTTPATPAGTPTTDIVNVRGALQDADDAAKWLMSHKSELSSPVFWRSTLGMVALIVGFFLHKQLDLSSLATALAAVSGAVIGAVTAIAHVIKVVEGSKLLGARLAYTTDLQLRRPSA